MADAGQPRFGLAARAPYAGALDFQKFSLPIPANLLYTSRHIHSTQCAFLCRCQAGKTPIISSDSLFSYMCRNRPACFYPITGNDWTTGTRFDSLPRGASAPLGRLAAVVDHAAGRRDAAGSLSLCLSFPCGMRGAGFFVIAGCIECGKDGQAANIEGGT